MNRGLAKRAIIENSRDSRHFQSLMARAVRRGDLEIHAYSLLTTHFHLLVRSPKAGLSGAMQWIENQYVRYFNRVRRRDGPLFRGRYTSRLVESERYWNILVHYIDQNAVQAGIASNSASYPNCSAYHYSRDKGPPWLTRSVVEGEVCARRAVEVYDPREYCSVFGETDSGNEAWVVERRTELAPGAEDPFDDLIGAAPAAVKTWMLRKLNLAERGVTSQPVLEPRVVDAWLKSHLESERASRSLAAGLFRTLCGLTFKEIALRLGTSLATAKRDLVTHAELARSDRDYIDLAATCVSGLMQSAYARLLE